MSIDIKNEQADRLARELSELTSKIITEKVIKALSKRLEKKKQINYGDTFTRRILGDL